MEVYFGNNEEKWDKWYNEINEMKLPIRKANTEYNKKDSFRPLKGITEEEKLQVNTTEDIEPVEEKKKEVADSSTQYHYTTKEFGSNTQPPRNRDQGVETHKTVFKSFGSNTEAKVLKDAGVATKVKLFKSSSVNTDQTHYVDTNEAQEIAQSCWQLILNQKEYESEIVKREESKKNLRMYSKFFEDALPENKAFLYEELKAKFMSFNNWSVESTNDGWLVYSSKTPSELIKEKSKIKEEIKKTRTEFKSSEQEASVFTEMLNNNTKISICMLLLTIYLLFSARGWNFVSSVVLWLLIPLMLVTAVAISENKNLRTPIKVEHTEKKHSIYKVKSKMHCHPDDLAFALCKPHHRKQWDMNILSFMNDDQSSPVFKRDLKIQYQSFLGGSFIENVSYSFYREEEGLYYILEESEFDRFNNERTHRLIELRSQMDKHQTEYYWVTVFGEVNPIIAAHKNEETFKLDYVRGCLTYIANSTDLPSSQLTLSLRKSSSIPSEGDRFKNEGKLRFSFKKLGESLEQINESAELVSDDVEEYKMSMINLKDTLLTVDEFICGEGESEDYEIDIHDKIYDEVDDILRTESDDLSLIKNEAANFDKRNGRFISRDSKGSKDESHEDIIKLTETVSGKEESDNEDDKWNLLVERAEAKLNDFNNIQISKESFQKDINTADTIREESGKILGVNQGKDTNGAVVSPFKGTSNNANLALGISTFDPNWVPRKNGEKKPQKDV